MENSRFLNKLCNLFCKNSIISPKRDENEFSFSVTISFDNTKYRHTTFTFYC